MKKLHIGFLSAAGIARKNWKSILSSGNCVVAAVASRDMQKSRRFIQECQAENSFDLVPDALGSYEELIAADRSAQRMGAARGGGRQAHPLRKTLRR
jgi:predicted dehydrogenase